MSKRRSGEREGEEKAREIDTERERGGRGRVCVNVVCVVCELARLHAYARVRVYMCA